MGERDIVWVIKVDKDHIFGEKSLLYIGDLDREKSYIWERGDKCCQRPYIWWKKNYFLLVSNDERAYLSEIKVERGYMDNLNWKGPYIWW